MEGATNFGEHPRPYQVFMLSLCIYAIFVLVLETIVSLDANTLQVLAFADTVLCGLFFIDFVISWAHADKPMDVSETVFQNHSPGHGEQMV